MSHIEFSYTLTEEEVFEGLKYSGIYKTSGKRAVIETSVLAVLFLFFLISFLYNKEFFNLVMGLITLGVVLGVTLVPRLDMRKQAKQGQNTVKVRLYEDKLYADTAEGSRKISLQGAKVKTVGKKTQLTAVLPEDGGLLLIPVRAIPKDVRGRALNLLLQNN